MNSEHRQDLDHSAERPKILMFELDEFMRDMFELKCRNAGFDFVGIASADDIVEQAVSHRPDIISLDILSPHKVDGFLAIEMLKKDQRTKDIPVVFLTNLSDEETIEKSKQLGAAAFILKQNVTPSDVIQQIFAVLGSPK